jgi:hypothetical protein
MRMTLAPRFGTRFRRLGLLAAALAVGCAAACTSGTTPDCSDAQCGQPASDGATADGQGQPGDDSGQPDANEAGDTGPSGSDASEAAATDASEGGHEGGEGGVSEGGDSGPRDASDAG